MRTTAVVVVTASGRLKRAAPPSKAVAIVLIETAAGIAFGTAVIIIANSRRRYWRWRRGARIRGILTIFNRIRGLNCNSTFACCCIG